MANRWVSLCAIEKIGHEIDAWLNGKDHAWLECALQAQGTVARTGVPCAPRGIAPNVVRVDPEQMPEPMRHEHRTDIRGHHLLHIALQEPSDCQALKADTVGKLVHRSPLDPR